MADYFANTRTNYFHVLDPEKYGNLVDKIVASDEVHAWVKTDEYGYPTYAFGCFGEIYGIPVSSDGTEPNDYDDEDIEYSYDAMLRELQSCIGKGDAILIFESGHCKLQEVTGYLTVVTSEKIKKTSLERLGIGIARELLDNPSFTTQCDC